MNGKDKKFIIKEKTTTARLKEDNKVKYRIKVVGGEEVTIKESDKDGTKMSKKVKIKMVKIKEGKDESSIDNASAKDVDVTYKIGHLFHYFETPEEIDGVKFEKPVELPVKGVWECTTWALWAYLVVGLLVIIGLVWWMVWGFGKKKEEDEDKDF